MANITVKRVNGTWIIHEKGEPTVKGTHAQIIAYLYNIWQWGE